MGTDIQVVDPAEIELTEPVDGLLEQSVFLGSRRLVLLRVDRETAWHFRDGAVYGWVRNGEGHVAYDDRQAELRAGEFLRVPGDTVHRYAAGRDRLEVLAVVDGGAAREADAPTADDEAGIEVVGPAGLVPTVASPDLTRETPFPDAPVLLMHVRAPGGVAAGWHHHGDNVYFGYAVDGPSETEYGSAGEKVARIEIGECFHVPPGLVHRDTNPTDETHTGIIWLCGGEPWVVNVDGPE